MDLADEACTNTTDELGRTPAVWYPFDGSTANYGTMREHVLLCTAYEESSVVAAPAAYADAPAQYSTRSGDGGLHAMRHVLDFSQRAFKCRSSTAAPYAAQSFSTSKWLYIPFSSAATDRPASVFSSVNGYTPAGSPVDDTANVSTALTQILREGDDFVLSHEGAMRYTNVETNLALNSMDALASYADRWIFEVFTYYINGIVRVMHCKDMSQNNWVWYRDCESTVDVSSLGETGFNAHYYELGQYSNIKMSDFRMYLGINLSPQDVLDMYLLGPGLPRCTKPTTTTTPAPTATTTTTPVVVAPVAALREPTGNTPPREAPAPPDRTTSASGLGALMAVVGGVVLCGISVLACACRNTHSRQELAAAQAAYGSSATYAASCHLPPSCYLPPYMHMPLEEPQYSPGRGREHGLHFTVNPVSSPEICRWGYRVDRRAYAS